MTVGQRIKTLRETQDKTQESLAKFVGVTKGTIAQYESGTIIDIPPSRLECVAEFLNTTPAHLNGWDETRYKKESEKLASSDKDLSLMYQYLTLLSSESLQEVWRCITQQLADELERKNKGE